MRLNYLLESVLDLLGGFDLAIFVERSHFQSRMHLHVRIQRVPPLERLVTNGTHVKIVLGMEPFDVHEQLFAASRAELAFVAIKLFVGHMALHMGPKRPLARAAVLAQLALVRRFAGVRPDVVHQERLVRGAVIALGAPRGSRE